MKVKYFKRLFIIVLALCTFILASCENNDTTSTITSTKEVETYQIYKDLSYGDNQRNALDLYMPSNYQNHSIVLFLHGGAWVSGDKSFYKDYMTKIAALGIPCASMNYRYISKNVSCYDILDDITNALSFLKEYSLNNFNVELNKLALFGYSAGAHHSLLYGNKNKNISPIDVKMIVSLAGPTDLTLDSYYQESELSYTLFSYMIDKKFTKDNRDSVRDDLLAISPITYIDSNSVPTIIVQGLKDTSVDPINSYNLDEQLTLNNAPHKFITMPNSDHLLSKDKKIFASLYFEFSNFATMYSNEE
jgi:acetyl esterase/lipase